MEEKDIKYKFFSEEIAKKFCDQFHQGFVDLLEPCSEFEPVEYNIAPSTVLYKMRGKSDIDEIVAQLDPTFDHRYSAVLDKRDRVVFLVEEIVDRFVSREAESRPINQFQLAETIFRINNESSYRISFNGEDDFINVSIHDTNLLINKNLLLDNININYFRYIYKCKTAEELYKYIKNETIELFPCLYYCFFPENIIPQKINKFNERIVQCTNGEISLDELKNDAREFINFFNSSTEDAYKEIYNRINKTTYHMFLIDLMSMILPNEWFVPVINCNKLKFSEKTIKSFI